MAIRIQGFAMKLKIKEFLTSPEVTSLSEETQNSYRYSLEPFRQYCSVHNIDEPTGFQEHMPKLANYMKESKKISGKSIQQYLVIVKMFLKWSGTPVDYEYRISSEEKKATQKKRLQRWFDEDDIRKSLAYKFSDNQPEVRIRNQLLVRLLYETGARVRELSCVKIADVDVEDGIIWLYDSKTEPRPAFFGEETKELFRQLRNFKLFWTGNIFPQEDSLKLTVSDMLKALQMKNGKDGRGPHTFRHYLASYLFYQGDMRVEDIATLLGDTVKTIVDVYLHPTPLMLRSRVAKAMGWEE